MQYRVTTEDGTVHELDADGIQEAIEAIEAKGYTLSQITSVSYFSTIYDQWWNADNMLRAYRAAKTFKED